MGSENFDKIITGLMKGSLDKIFLSDELSSDQIRVAINCGKYLYSLYYKQNLSLENIKQAVKKGLSLDLLNLYQINLNYISSFPRYCCTTCSRFFNSSKIPKSCPYCKGTKNYDRDSFYFDNILMNIPPPLGHHEIKCDNCGVVFVVETNDANFCVGCKKEFTVEGGISLEEHQSIILDKMEL